jgi:hypothetical protein
VTTDGTVQVFPAKAKIREMTPARVVVSANGNLLVLAFGERTPTFPLDGLARHPVHGVVLVLSRNETSSPFWRELFTGQLFGIAAAA